MNISGILLLILSAILYVNTITHQHRRLSRKEKYCGDKLTLTMNKLCDGNYYEKTKRRGGEFHNDDFVELLENYVEMNDDEYKYPFIPRELAKSLVPLKIRRDNDNGIADECCTKACTEKELMSYCGNEE